MIDSVSDTLSIHMYAGEMHAGEIHAGAIYDSWTSCDFDTLSMPASEHVVTVDKEELEEHDGGESTKVSRNVWVLLLVSIKVLICCNNFNSSNNGHNMSIYDSESYNTSDE